MLKSLGSAGGVELGAFRSAIDLSGQYGMKYRLIRGVKHPSKSFGEASFFLH